MYDASGFPAAAEVLDDRPVGPVDLAWQPDLLAEPTGIDASATARRVRLDATSWVDHVPGWLRGSDAVFAELAATAEWTAKTVLMWDKPVAEPRLTARWRTGEEPPVLAEIRQALRTRYDVGFDSVGVNLYRDGSDSVAWHRDRVHRTLVEPMVATVTLGSARQFVLRPHGGDATRVTLTPHAGDLIVMGGRCQQDWEHTVPKRRSAEPRMAITVRHGAAPRDSAPGSSALPRTGAPLS